MFKYQSIELETCNTNGLSTSSIKHVLLILTRHLGPQRGGINNMYISLSYSLMFNETKLYIQL